VASRLRWDGVSRHGHWKEKMIGSNPEPREGGEKGVTIRCSASKIGGVEAMKEKSSYKMEARSLLGMKE